MQARVFVIVLIALCAISILAVTSRDRANRPPPGRVVVRYWEKWTGREADQMQSIVDDFNATVGREKNIWVDYLSMSAVDQKTLLATAAGVPPDIAGLWDAQLAQFAGMGALTALDDLAADHRLTRDKYKPVFYDGCTYEGRLYALPSTPGTVALHYNRRIFRERAGALHAAGLDPARPPRTIAELDRYAAALDVRDAAGNLVAAGFLPQEPGWWNAQMPFWFGGRLYDESTRRVTFTEPAVIAAYTWMQGYTQRLGAAAIQQFRTTVGKDNFDSPQSPFFTGAVAMEIEGVWKANYIDKLNPRMNNRGNLSASEIAKLSRSQRRDNCDWAAAPFPTADASSPPVTYAQTDILAIPSTSRHKAEAFEFIAFVNRQDVMEKLVSKHCKNSPLAAMSSDYIAHHPNPFIEVFEEMSASPAARSLPPLPVWPEVKAELDFAIERICLGEVKPRAALEAAQVRAQAAVDRFFAREDQRQQQAGRR